MYCKVQYIRLNLSERLGIIWSSVIFEKACVYSCDGRWDTDELLNMDLLNMVLVS